jgi:hypothetical protein
MGVERNPIRRNIEKQVSSQKQYMKALRAILEKDGQLFLLI